MLNAVLLQTCISSMFQTFSIRSSLLVQCVKTKYAPMLKQM